MDNALKPYACGILAHAMVDAMRELRARPGVAPERVAGVSGRVNPLAIKLEGRPDPKTGLEGRLSFQHAMAMALIDGAAYPAQFTDERVGDPAVASLRRKIDVLGDESIAQDACELTLTLTDGTRYTERVPHATGSIDNPLSDAQLDEKFRALAGSVLPRTRVEALLEALWQLERLPILASWSSFAAHKTEERSPMTSANAMHKQTVMPDSARRARSGIRSVLPPDPGIAPG